MLYYRQNSAYFDSNNIEASPAIIDTIKIQDSVNMAFQFSGGREISLQNIELENNFCEIPNYGGTFIAQFSDIVTITNVTVKNHFGGLFWLQYVLTQKFYNVTFTNITVYNSTSDFTQSVIYSSRTSEDVGRDNTEEPVTIFQNLHIDVTL